MVFSVIQLNLHVSILRVSLFHVFFVPVFVFLCILTFRFSQKFYLIQSTSNLKKIGYIYLFIMFIFFMSARELTLIFTINQIPLQMIIFLFMDHLNVSE